MKLFTKMKDGGPESPVTAYVLIEYKPLFSIMFLKFRKGTREEYHTHAFNALTLFIVGKMFEERLHLGINNDYFKIVKRYKKSIFPKITTKDNLHRITAKKDSWCFTIRGPWVNTWYEYNELTNTKTYLTHGRKIIKIYE